MITGTVRWFDESRGYGSIVRQDGGRDVFVHHSAIVSADINTLAEGQQVTFEIEQGQIGPTATNVQVA